MGPRFSIRYKFLAVTTVLLVVCVGVYLAATINEFRRDKEELIFDHISHQVRGLSSDLDSFFRGLKDQLRVAAYFHREKNRTKDLLFDDFFGANSDLVFVAASERFTQLDTVYYTNKDYMKTYALDGDFWTTRLPQEAPIPFREIQLEGEAIWRAQIPDGPPLIGIARNVVELDEKGVPRAQYAVIGFVKADRILNSLSGQRFNLIWLADREGRILLDPAGETETAAVPEELLNIARSSDVATTVTTYRIGEEKHYGAFSASAKGRVLVLSSVSEAKAFAVVGRLMLRSVLAASIAVTLAFILTYFFSRSLTRPLDTLMGGMKKVAEGDLETNIQVRSNDELAILAASFNLMIRDLKKSRAELEEINRDLEKKVLERTRQLDERNRAVKEAQEALLRSTRLAAVGEVAGIAAHEVLNPLQSIISRLTELKRRIEEDRAREAQLLIDIKNAWQKEYEQGGFQKLVQSWQTPSQVKPGESLWTEDLHNLELVGRNVTNEFQTLLHDSEFLIKESHRIGRIVNSFRSLSSVKSEIKALPLYDLVRHAVEIMADLAAKHNIKLVNHVGRDEGKVLVGEDEFIQVVTNLIRNSIHATSQRSNGEIVLRAERSPQHTYVYIRDNGEGIPEHVQAKLFDKPFTTKSAQEGTGFGLSLSRRLMRALRGDLTLKWSKVGQGSEFQITVQPAADAVEERNTA